MLDQQIDYPTRPKTSAMIVKLFQITLVVLVLLINLAIAFPSWAEKAPSLTSNPDYFQVGQKVIWLYKPRADSNDVQRIPAEVVKLSSKQVQIKVYKHNHEFVNRWVNPNKLENLQISSSATLNKSSPLQSSSLIVRKKIS